MKQIDCEGVGDNNGFFEATAEAGLSSVERLVMRDAEVTPERMREKAEALWQMLDDISTAGDMFKPDLNDPFVKYVLAQCEERSNEFTSDGYELFVTA